MLYIGYTPIHICVLSSHSIMIIRNPMDHHNHSQFFDSFSYISLYCRVYIHVMTSVYGSQRPICTTIGQRLPWHRSVGRRNSPDSWTIGAAKVEIVSAEPIIESVVYEV